MEEHSQQHLEVQLYLTELDSHEPTSVAIQLSTATAI